jgi:hypothetical protein
VLAASDKQRQGSATSAPTGDETSWLTEGHQCYSAAEEDPPEEEGRAHTTNVVEHGVATHLALDSGGNTSP